VSVAFVSLLNFLLLLAFKQVKIEAAKTEEAWQGAGEKVGLQIWRIVQFKVS